MNIKRLIPDKNIFILFLSFAVIFIAKNMIFHNFLFGSFDIPAITLPFKCCTYWYNQIICAVFFGMFVFITKRHWWTVFIHLFLDIWCISNLIYFRANELILDVNAMLMADNMQGFWSSVNLYFSRSYILFPLLSVFYALIVRKIPSPTKRYWKHTIPFVILVLAYTPFSQFRLWTGDAIETSKINCNYTGLRYYLSNYDSVYTPFYYARIEASRDYNHPSEQKWNMRYLKFRTISQYFFASIAYHISYQNLVNEGIVSSSLSASDISEIDALIYKKSVGEIKPENNLIIILVESFESWIIKNKTVCNEEIMPNLLNWLDKYPNLICYNIQSQVKHGVSGDGQMIVNTGLLPISSGAACRLYGDNIYPNIAHLYNESVTVNPAAGAWNQHVVNNSYGIMELFESPTMTNDERLFAEINNRLDSISEPFYLQGITVSSHSPFTSVKEELVHLPADFDATLKNYLNCMAYTDKCMKPFFDHFEKDSILRNSTIVITGDHTVFKSAMLNKFKPEIEKYNLGIKSSKNYTPLIIYSPEIQDKIRIDDICYQMDIYPTILNLTGCENYYWKGFGVNVTDSIARENRPISESKAFELSDKIIRNNYFKNGSIRTNSGK